MCRRFLEKWLVHEKKVYYNILWQILCALSTQRYHGDWCLKKKVPLWNENVCIQDLELLVWELSYFPDNNACICRKISGTEMCFLHILVTQRATLTRSVGHQNKITMQKITLLPPMDWIVHLCLASPNAVVLQVHFWHTQCPPTLYCSLRGHDSHMPTHMIHTRPFP